MWFFSDLWYALHQCITYFRLEMRPWYYAIWSLSRQQKSYTLHNIVLTLNYHFSTKYPYIFPKDEGLMSCSLSLIFWSYFSEIHRLPQWKTSRETVVWTLYSVYYHIDHVERVHACHRVCKTCVWVNLDRLGRNITGDHLEGCFIMCNIGLVSTYSYKYINVNHLLVECVSRRHVCIRYLIVSTRDRNSYVMVYYFIIWCLCEIKTAR